MSMEGTAQEKPAGPTREQYERWEQRQLRDSFAQSYLCGLAASGKLFTGVVPLREVAMSCYDMADAMLRERATRNAAEAPQG